MKNYLQDVQPKMTVDSYTSASQTSDPRMAMPMQPTPKIVNPNIKDTGAPVPFNPANTKTINGVFGSAIDQSFDRSLSTDPTQTM